MSDTERGIAPGFTIGKPNQGFGRRLALGLALAGVLTVSLPDRASAQSVGTLAGGATTGGATTGGAMNGATVVTLDAFAQMLLDQIQQMLAQEFGPIPPEVMDFLTDLILREFFLGSAMPPPLPAGSATTPSTGAPPMR